MRLTCRPERYQWSLIRTMISVNIPYYHDGGGWHLIADVQ